MRANSDVIYHQHHHQVSIVFGDIACNRPDVDSQNVRDNGSARPSNIFLFAKIAGTFAVAELLCAFEKIFFFKDFARLVCLRHDWKIR